MFLFKKTMSEDRFLEILLKGQLKIEGIVKDEFKKNYDSPTDMFRFHLEVTIFSLWLMTISLNSPNSKFLDRLRDAVCDRLDDQISFASCYPGRRNLPETIDQRYQNYFEAFRMWQQNPQSGHIIGSVMFEYIHNQFGLFSLREEIPEVGDIEAMNTFNLFAILFKKNLEFIESLRKKFKIKSLEA